MFSRIIKIIKTRYFKLGISAFLLLVLIMEISNHVIIAGSEDSLFSDVASIPFRKVGLVLGANKNAFGGKNLFFEYRIEAATELFKAGKIKHILVSGDNHIDSYDESTDMKNALVERGIPDSCITLDFAGFRTFDSVVRCMEIFGQSGFTIISQKFHNERAVYIANHFGADAIGFNAAEVPQNYSLKTKIREHFSKFKCILDLYVLKSQPKFLGSKEKIPV
jgi:SanA protein